MRRTLTVHQLYTHLKRKERKLGNVPVSQLPGGINLRTQFAELAQRSADDHELLKRDTQRSYCYVEELKVIGETLFMASQIGAYGEASANVNVTTGEVVHEGTEDEANILRARSLLLVPPVGTHALLFSEVLGISSAGSRLLQQFHQEWSSVFPEHTLVANTVNEGAAWLNDVRVTAIEAEVYQWSTDSADEGVPERVKVRQRLMPEKGRPHFPKSINKVIQNEDLRGKLFNFRDDLTPDRILVDVVGHEGRKKTYEVDHPQTPTMRLLLSDTAEPPLSDDDFMARCWIEAKEIYPRLGGEWQTGWEGSGK